MSTAMETLLQAHADSVTSVGAPRIAQVATYAYAQAMKYAHSSAVVDYVASLHAVPEADPRVCPAAAPGEFKDGELVIVRALTGTPALEAALEQWRVCREYICAQGATHLFQTDGFLAHFMSVPMTEGTLLRLFKVIVLSAGIKETVVYDSNLTHHNTVESYVAAMEAVVEKLQLWEGAGIADLMHYLHHHEPDDTWEAVQGASGKEPESDEFELRKHMQEDRAFRLNVLRLCANNVGETLGLDPKTVFDSVKANPKYKTVWGQLRAWVLQPWLERAQRVEGLWRRSSNNDGRRFKWIESQQGAVLQRKIVQLGHLIVTVSVARGLCAGRAAESVVCLFHIFKHPRQLALQQLGLLSEPKLAARLQLFNILAASAQLVCSSPLEPMVPVFRTLEDNGVLVPFAEASEDVRRAIARLQSGGDRNPVLHTLFYGSDKFWVIAPETIQVQTRSPKAPTR